MKTKTYRDKNGDTWFYSEIGPTIIPFEPNFSGIKNGKSVTEYWEDKVMTPQEEAEMLRKAFPVQPSRLGFSIIFMLKPREGGWKGE